VLAGIRRERERVACGSAAEITCIVWFAQHHGLRRLTTGVKKDYIGIMMSVSQCAPQCIGDSPLPTFCARPNLPAARAWIVRPQRVAAQRGRPADGTPPRLRGQAPSPRSVTCCLRRSTKCEPSSSLGVQIQIEQLHWQQSEAYLVRTY
jgi:hypothetical protein